MSLVPESEISLNKSLHESDNNFGNRSSAAGLATRLPLAMQRLSSIGACNSFLDYGTGKGKLVQRLRHELPSTFQIDGYDPAVNEWSTKPLGKSYDLVCSFDVLEHIEPRSIESVVADISSYTAGLCYVVIDLQPAVKHISDGRNAHILLAPIDWWLGVFARHFICNLSFPILHSSGHPQKLVICSTNKLNKIHLLTLFIHKLKINELIMYGGTLG